MPPSGIHRGSSTKAVPALLRDTVQQDSSAPRFIDIEFHGDMVTQKSLETKPLQSRNAWIGATDLHISVQIEIGDRSLYLHKFPLFSKSEKLNRLVFESRDTELVRVKLADIPGGAEAFELVARFLYGGEIEVTSDNVAALRCAAEYLEISDTLVAKTENFLNFVVASSWRDSISVLRMCSDLVPWAEELQIVRRCSESVAWKCFDPHSARWSFSTGKDALSRDWWFHDVCSLRIDTFTKVVHGLTAKGVSPMLVAAAVECYAEKWLPRGSEPGISTKLSKLKESEVSFGAKALQCQSNRAVVQGVVSLLAPGPESAPLKLLLKLLRVACASDALPFCKTDLAKRIGVHFEKLALDDLLIPAEGESTYDVDVVQQIVESYLQHQNCATSPPFSPRSSIISGSSMLTSTSTSTSRCSQRLSSASSTDLSSTSASDSGITVRSSGTSVSSSHSGCCLSFASETTGTSSHAFSETSSQGDDSNVKLAVRVAESSKKFDVEHPSRLRSQLPSTTGNVKLGQLLEMFLDEVARDSSISLGKFVSLADLLTEFPRDSDDGIYRAIDTFLRAHPTLKEMERKKLCRVIDTGALSLAASVHAASNERLPLRVIVQVLFSEQIKLRNAMTGNEVMIDKEVESSRLLPNFSSPTSISESSSDPTFPSNSNSSNSCSSSATKSQFTNGGAGGNAVSSQTAMKEALRFVTAEVESLKKVVQDIETVKTRLNVMESLQLEIGSVASRFEEMMHDYTGMIQQVEELTRGSKQKSGWSSGWKKVTKSFHSKDQHESTTSKSEHHNSDTLPTPRRMAQAQEHTTDSVPAAALQPPITSTSQPPRNPTSQPPRITWTSAPPKPPEQSDSTIQLPEQEPLPLKTAPIVPAKDEASLEPQAGKEGETPPPSTSGRPESKPESTPESEPESEPEMSLRSLKDRLDQRDESNHPSNHTRRKQCRSSSPEYVRRRDRQLYDSDDSVSVTSSSSYTSVSTSVSSVYSRSSRQRRRDRSEGRRSVEIDVHHSRKRPSSVHKSEHSGGGNSHRQHHRQRHRSSSKHRRKEGAEKHSGHCSHGSHNDHEPEHNNHLVDSHPRHSNNRDHHRGAIVSHHSSHRPKDQRKEVSSKHSSRHRRHQRHGHHQDSDSGGSSDSGSRRRYR